MVEEDYRANFADRGMELPPGKAASRAEHSFIKELRGLTDEEAVSQIRENSYRHADPWHTDFSGTQPHIQIVSVK